jgi:hypothetical protein
MTYLGSGAFSNVYKVDNGKFLKISRAASLENPTTPPRTSVSCPDSSCHSWRDLHNEGFQIEWNHRQATARHAVYNALEHAHDQSIFHLHVRPGNII